MSVFKKTQVLIESKIVKLVCPAGPVNVQS